MLLLVLTMTGCFTSIKKHEDPFYNGAGTYDSGRLPLLNPYYLVYIDEQHGWQMPIEGNFPEDQYYYNLGDLLEVTKVAVENGVIMVYTPYIRGVDVSIGQKESHWFVMIPSNENFEMGFGSETEFLNYVQELGISEPEWVDPSAAYEEFGNSGCLNWIPDCP